jgi:hypothetical protein
MGRFLRWWEFCGMLCMVSAATRGQSGCMQVSRRDDERLRGTVRLAPVADGRDLSGTLELRRTFGKLAPADRTPVDPSPARNRL